MAAVPGTTISMVATDGSGPTTSVPSGTKKTAVPKPIDVWMVVAISARTTTAASSGAPDHRAPPPGRPWELAVPGTPAVLLTPAVEHRDA